MFILRNKKIQNERLSTFSIICYVHSPYKEDGVSYHMIHISDEIAFFLMNNKTTYHTMIIRTPHFLVHVSTITKWYKVWSGRINRLGSSLFESTAVYIDPSSSHTCTNAHKHTHTRTDRQYKISAFPTSVASITSITAIA